jgi:hypothetical protein
MIFYDGMYYGDWSVNLVDAAEVDGPFDPKKARPR